MTHLIRLYRIEMLLLLFILIFTFSPFAQAENTQVIDLEVDNLNGVDGLGGVSDLAISADGQHLYATGFSDNAVAVFARDSVGQLSLIQVINNSDIGSFGLQGAFAVGVSPDGKHVYVASVLDSALVVFSRNASDGTLSLLEMLQDDLGGVDGLSGANAIAFSSDNLRVYVTSAGDKALAVFDRDPSSGSLSFLTLQRDGANEVNNLAGANAISVVPGNVFIYIAATTDNAISLFTRNPSLGEIAFVTTYQDGIDGISGLKGATDLAISPDARYIYVASQVDNAVVAFDREMATGILSFSADKVYRNGENGIEGLNDANAIAMSPDGLRLYVAGSDTLVVFNRNVETGQLTFRSVLKNNTQDLTTLDNISAIVASSEAGIIYTAAFSSDAITALNTFSADLSVAIATPETVAINSSFSYALTVTNHGPDTATGVTLTDVLPPGTIFTSAISSQGVCQYNGSTHQVNCDLDAIKINAAINITIALTAPTAVGSGLITNTASVSAVQADANTANNSASKETTLVESIITADLKVSISTDLDIVSTNNALNYTIRVTNLGPDIANTVVLKNTLSSQVTYNAANSDARCIQNAQTVTCQLNTLAINDSVQVPIQVTTSSVKGPISLTAQVSGADIDSNIENNQVTKTNMVDVLEFDLVMTDAVAIPSTLAVGNELTYKITIANQGSTTVSGITITGFMPPQVDYVSDSSGCTHEQSHVICELSSLAPSLVREVVITGRAVQTGENILSTFFVTANGSDTNETNNLKSVLVHNITGIAADFVVTANDEGLSVLIDNPITYTISVINNGANEAAATLNVALSGDNVHIEEISIEEISEEGCGTGPSFNCNLGLVPVGETKTVTLKAVPTVAEILTLTVEVISDAFDPNLPNIAQVETAVTNKEADLRISLATVPNPTFLGKEMTYTTTVTNNGPHQATGVNITHELPPSVTYISNESSQGETCEMTDNVITCLLGPINSHANATVNTIVKPQSLGQLSSFASVTSSSFDPVSSNNSISLETSINPQTADLALTISGTPEPVLVDNPLTYTLTITNQGPDPAININIINELPENLLLQSPVTMNPVEIAGSCAEMIVDGKLNCTIESLPNEGVVTLSFVVQPTVAGQLNFSALLSSAAIDSNEGNNNATITTRVNMPSTLYFIETKKNGINGMQGLQGAFALTISSDGQFIYAVGFSDNAVAVFRRNASDGKLQFIQVLRPDEGMNKPSAITLSPDGAYAYIASFGENAVSVFRRDSSSGFLTFVASYKSGDGSIDGLEGAFALAATDTHLYVAGTRDNALAIFSRKSQSGELSFIEALRFEEESQSLTGINAIAITPNGSHLFATSSNADRLSVFSRNATSGQLNLIQTLTNDVDGIQGLDIANGVVVSSDGQFVYTTAGGNDNAVAVFSFATGNLSFITAYRNGTGNIEGLNGAAGIALSSDGEILYVAGANDNALVVFRRNTETGQLDFLGSQKDGIEQLDGLSGARSVVVSPAGAHIYVASFSDNAITVFSIATADLSLTISENSASVKIGDTLIDTLTVTNHGPHQATGVILEGQFDNQAEIIDLLTVEPSQGTCIATSENIVCTLGTLNPDDKATITATLSPTEVGELSLSATVTAKQFDSSPNTATETIQVFLESDLGIEIKGSAAIAAVKLPLTYQITVTNHGSTTVKQITLRDVIPVEATFESVNVNDDSSTCSFDKASHTVTCTISSLAGNAHSLVTIIITPTTEGTTLKNIASVSAEIVDSNSANNQVTHTAEVSFNVIEVTSNNTDINLHNPHISANGAIIGGSISGQIKNQGLLSEVRILSDSTVSGGKLSKTIINEGMIENVQLLSDTIINGGTVRGKIKGFPTAPATLNTKIAAGTQLSYVIIGQNSQVSPTTVLGKGVSFIANSTIPEGLNLTSTFSTLTGPIAGSLALDLSHTVLMVGMTQLEAINAIPALKSNDLVFSQTTDSGLLVLPIGDEQMVLHPITVEQTSPASIPKMEVHPSGNVSFITETGRKIEAQPTVQDQKALQITLSEVGVAQIEFLDNGHLSIKSSGNTIIVRPDLYTYSTDSTLALDFPPSPIVTGLGELTFRFKDTEGVQREQKLYSVSAHQAELHSMLEGYPGASAVTFFNNGKVSVKIGARTYSGVFDYFISAGTVKTVTQLLFVPDINGDKSEEVRISYTNGDEQILYVMPFPEVAADIQAIEAVETAGYAVSQALHGNYQLVQGDTQLLMTVSSIKQVNDDTPPSMEIQSDGSVIFITASGSEITMQPTMQDLPALQAVLGDYGISKVIVEDNGNLTIPINDSISATARPDLSSTPAWFGAQLGLHNLPTLLPGVLNIILVYLDDSGQKRQQYLYPVAKYPQALYTFFEKMSGVKQVIFDNNGTIEVEGSNLSFRGIMDYAVESGQTATGSIQFIDTPDANGDEIDDFAVIYGTGERQIIYQIPEVPF